jgi:hypothetical protein
MPEGARPRADGWLPVAAAALLAMLAVFVVWGSLNPVPVMHDEWAYWMQADQYAHLHWSVPAPPVPSFFEQFYVLVTPVFAAKYPPGHALVLAPGFALGMPALAPLLLTAATAALVFALARRLAGVPIAALTWALWLGTFGNLRFRATYFSEVTTSLCWLAAWWALLEWRATRRPRWMVALAVAVGWGAITRPATMFVFAIPVGVVVLRDTVAGKRWNQLGLGVAVGLVVLAILPLWNAETTGDWRVSPLALYTRQYVPFDVPGFSVPSTAPERALPPEMERARGFLRDVKEAQVVDPSWKTAGDRGWELFRDSFGGWRVPFAVAFAVGVCTAGATVWFALGTSALLMLAYLTQAHTPDWIVYYLETTPVLAFTAAMGAAWIVRRVVREPVPRWIPIAVGAVMALLLVRDVLSTRTVLDRIAATPRTFRALVASLPKAPNIVFVKYAPRRSMHISLVDNTGMLATAPTWIVHHHGTDDLQLMDAAPGRTAYLFDEATRQFQEMRR